MVPEARMGARLTNAATYRALGPLKPSAAEGRGWRDRGGAPPEEGPGVSARAQLLVPWPAGGERLCQEL